MPLVASPASKNVSKILLNIVFWAVFISLLLASARALSILVPASKIRELGGFFADI
jgi:hypothetical protein